METRRARRHKKTSVLLALALLLVGGAAAASAAPDLFPASGGPNGGRGVDGGDRTTLNIPIGGLAPGTAARGRHLVENTSGQPLRYTLVSSSLDGDGKGLRDVVWVTIKASHPSSPDGSCDSSEDATLYAGRLGATSAGFGDPRIGGQAGDRLLAPGQREALCFEIEMPLDAGNEFQGAVTSSIWTIATEQVDGNS
jgi:hypothetical protein